MSKSYYAGMELDAPCGRCKGDTRHRILTITNGIPEKLICATCNSIHKFREERPDLPARTPRSSGSPGTAAVRAATAPSPSRWQELMIQEQAGSKARPYSVAERWEEGQWVDHPTFGMGRIQKRAGKKVDVLFRDGLKTLLSA